MIGIAVFGYGYWGPNLVRNFSNAVGSEVLAICDLNPDRLALAKQRHPGVFLSTDTSEIINHPNVDAVVIATPVSTHYSIAVMALKAGKHVLLEKPLTLNSDDAKRLIDEALHQNVTLMVDHPFLYTGAIRKIHELAESGVIGNIYYYDSVRVNLGLFQHDVSVIWDLAVHDLSIMDFILPEYPTAVSATGMSHVKDQPENIAYLTMFFNSNLIAHIHINWLAPVKVRKTLISGSKKMVIYDDLDPVNPIKVYDSGIEVGDDPEGIYNMQIGYRTGDLWCPKVDKIEALLTLANHFNACIEGKEQPISSAEQGLRIVRIMEAATESMEKNGEMIRLD